MADDVLSPDEARLHTFLSRQDIPEPVKRQAVALYKRQREPGVAMGAAVGSVLPGGPDPNEPGLGTAATEMAGGSVGQYLGGGIGPTAAIGSGIGTAVGGAVGDVGAGRPLSVPRTVGRLVTGTVIPPAVSKLGKLAGKGIGAGARAAARAFPSFAEFAERVAPGVLGRGTKALEATGGLGDTPAETVIERFRQWSEALYGHVDELAGDAPVVPTSSFKTAAEGLRSVPGLSQEERAAFAQMTQSDAVPLNVARRLESGFKRLARKRIGQKAMGDTVSHEWSTLADSVGDDIEQFLATPEAVQSGVGKALNVAKQTYREGKQALDATEIYRRSITPGGHFDPARFSRYVKRLDDKGILGRVMGKDRAPVLRELAAEFGAQTDPSRTMAGHVARRIGYAAPVAGAVGAEELYRHGQITPGRLAGAGLTLAALHPAGRPALASILGQGLAAGARQQLGQGDETSEFIKYLGSQGFSP